MTHIQELFIQNLRFFRSKKGISQFQLSEMVNISPNYLNAVENGKNFPSLEVLQRIVEVLEILPYQLFLENPNMQNKTGLYERSILSQELNYLKQKFNQEFEEVIKKYSGSDKQSKAKIKRSDS